MNFIGIVAHNNVNYLTNEKSVLWRELVLRRKRRKLSRREPTGREKTGKGK